MPRHLTVLIQIGFTLERLAAFYARDYSFSSVYFQVRDKRPFLQELLPADGAGVRHAAVHAPVVHQLELAGERGPAVPAHERRQRPVEPAVHH